MSKRSDSEAQNSAAPIQTRNKVLLQLEESEFDVLLPALTEIELSSGSVIYRPEQEIDYLYFPNDLLVSVFASTEEGQSVAVGIIGNEGVVGFDALMGASHAPYAVSALYGNGTYRIRVSDVVGPFNQCGALHDAILQFTQRFMVQVSQKTLCNRLHTVDQRLSRWLLMFVDRSPSGTLKITQEGLASVLGSTRASVTLAAIELQNKGLITYFRGKIDILDHKGIEAESCDCYDIIRRAYEDE